MPYKARKIGFASKDRTTGEEIQVQGTGLRVLGPVPDDCEISFAGPDGDRVPLRQDELYHFPFTSLWLFHPAQAPTQPKASLVIFQSGGCFAPVPAESELRFGKATATAPELAAAVPGKVIRLFSYRFMLTANVTRAAAGVIYLALLEQGVEIAQTRYPVYIPAAVVSNAIGALDTGLIDLGRGHKLTADKALQMSAPTLASGELHAFAQYRYEDAQ